MSKGQFSIRQLFLAVIVIAGVLGAWANWPFVSRYRVNRVAVGMTQPQVLEIMGQPHRAMKRSDGSERWTWDAWFLRISAVDFEGGIVTDAYDNLW